MTTIRLILFTIIVPGAVAGYIPYFLHLKYGGTDLGPVSYVGLLFLTAGILFYISSALNFLLRGKGTPSIWFAKKLRFIMGEEPLKLVSSGLYNRSRNPMYLGVLSCVLGQAILLGSVAILIYNISIILFFHLVVVFIEEPHLRKKFGADYETYLTEVPRWIGFKEKKSRTD